MEISNTMFIYWYIQIGKEHFKRMQRGVRQKNLNLSMIKELPVFSVPVTLQCKFATYVQDVVSKKEIMQSSFSKQVDNFNSLTQRAFKGELELV